MASDEATAKLVFSYNSFLVDFLLLAKRISPEIKQRVKEHHRSVDKRDPQHLDFGAKNLPLDGLSTTKPSMLDKADASILDACIVDGITVMDIVGNESKEEDQEGLRIGMLRNLYVLASIARLQLLASSVAGDAMLEPLLELIMRIQAVGTWSGWPEPAPSITNLDTAIAEVDDECIRGLLGGLFDMCVTQATTSKDGIADVPEALRDTLSNLKNSKIGSIAKEIAEEIDFSGIDAGKPEEWLDISNISNPNSFIGNIVGKLGTKLTAKMQNGELKQEDIITDVMSLMMSMGGGADAPNTPGNAGPDIFKMMAGMMGNGGGFPTMPSLAGSHKVKR